MAGLTGRVLAALAAGAAFVVSIGALHYGVGQGTLGLVSEPVESFPPVRWQKLPADRPARVLLLGTSLTAGGVWTDALQAELSACRPEGVVVERLARPGANSAWGQEALSQRLAAGSPPDLMVIEFSINDASLWRGMTLGKSHERHVGMLTLAQRAGVTVWLSTMSPAIGAEVLERPGQVAYRAAYVSLARSHDAGLIAMVPAWMALSPEARGRALPDNLHPTDAAMIDIAVPALMAALLPVVCPAG